MKLLAISKFYFLLLFIVFFAPGNLEANSENDKIIIDTQRKVAKELRSQAPIKINEQMTIISAMSIEKTLVYIYRLEEYKDELERIGYKEKLAPHIKNSFCSQSYLVKMMRRHGANYVYQFKSIDGFFIQEIRFKNGSCRGF